ncbi:hypothetical protein C4K12_4116 [Pseudomonas chlororaphis subsp. aureofaciens]|nr:hypothetical protein C4K12_4116 [Pseudomonas chlororaphis subsp. aureofaciens]
MGILRAPRPCGSIAASRARQRLQGMVTPSISGQARCLCSRCRRLRSSGTLAGSLRALETLWVYRSLAGSAAATGNGDTLDILGRPDVCVAAAAGCDRAARSRGACGRWRPCGSIAASQARQRLQGTGTPLDIPAGPDVCVAAAAGCDRAARSRGACGRWRPCGSIAASRGSAAATGNGDTPRYSGRARCLCSRCRRLRSSGTLVGILRAPRPCGSIAASRARQRLQGMSALVGALVLPAQCPQGRVA